MRCWQTGVGFAFALAGCGASLPRPMTAQDLARLESSDALVAYLAQPDASPSVCDPRAAGPHVRHVDARALSSVVGGLTSGRIDPAVWRRCVDALAGAPPVNVALVDAVARRYLALFEERGLETSPALRERLAAMQGFYIERPAALDGHPDVMGPILDEIRRQLDRRKVGPVAARFGNELLAVVDLEHGRYGGRTVDAAALDDLASRREETLLRRFSDRLPSEALRVEARRRVIRLAIASSDYAEVRADGDAVEERIVHQGVNRISLLEHPPATATLDPHRVAGRGVLVRQDLPKQTATLLGTSDRFGVSVLPELSFVDALWIEVAGVSCPITICRSPRMLDPSPCVGVDDVKIESTLAYLDRGGAFRFVDRVSASEVVSLARAGHALALPVSAAGRRLVTFEWPLRFERPKNLVLDGVAGAGPNLKVIVETPDPSRFSFTVTGQGFQYRAVLENADLPAFRIVSRGAAGRAGADGPAGLDGAPGQDGLGASCPASGGGDGAPGGDGGSGGAGENASNGGDGGDIDIELACGAAPGIVQALTRIIVSEGGPGGSGGAGGPGGRGGRGGAGGSGTTCTDSDGNGTSLGAGSSGMSGHDGTNGSRGFDGSRGRPGRARVNCF
jgi:hypothetical protein